jgi:hypothetical protein
MDMQRATYASEAVDRAMALEYPEALLRAVDCALRVFNPATGECLDFDELAAAIAPLVPAPAAALYDYIKVSDVKANNTAGGAFNNGAWRTRDINTEDADTGGHCAIAANQITLQAGTYVCRICAPAFFVEEHKLRLRNITAGATTIMGTSEANDNSTPGWAQTRSFIIGRFTIGSATVFEIQHQCATTRAGNGFGVPSNFGVDEIYTIAEFWREPD